MADREIEREDKFDVDASFRMPDLADLAPAGGSLRRETRHLRNVYFDTAEQDLLRNRVTLRRRHGGPDEGWHLKLPADAGARTEVRLPPDEARLPPKRLREVTAGLRRGRPVRQVAVLQTERRAVQLLDAGGAVVAEVADDVVHASAGAVSDGALLSQWREVEVELGPADGADEARLAAIGDRLRAAGATPAGFASKLARALAEPRSDAATRGPASGSRPTGGPSTATAGGVVLAYLADQRAAIIAGDLALRLGDDAIHPTRVATRRYRSTVRTFATLFDQDRAAALDAELRWYAGVLGGVRDGAVMRERMAAAVADVPVSARLGPVGGDIDQHLVADSARHGADLSRALDGRRYLALLTELDAWLVDPPFTPPAQDPAAAVTALVAKAGRQVAKRLSIALEQEDDDALHPARKAAKRARYAAELAAPVLGAKKSERRVTRYTELQDILGEYQDSVVAAELLLRLGREAGTRPGENGFAYGVLYAEELQRGRAARRRARKRLRKLAG